MEVFVGSFGFLAAGLVFYAFAERRSWRAEQPTAAATSIRIEPELKP